MADPPGRCHNFGIPRLTAADASIASLDDAQLRNCIIATQFQRFVWSFISNCSGDQPIEGGL